MYQPTLRAMAKPATVYVVDDDPGIRNSLQMVLATAGLNAGVYNSAENFLEDYDGRSPGCLLLDMYMPGMHGIDLVRTLRERGCRLPILVITGSATVRMAIDTMKLGATDFMEKPVPSSTLLEKIRHALAAEIESHANVSQRSALTIRLNTLSPREKELLDLLVAGHSNKQVALQLKISIKTVENHRSKLMKKMGATNAAELVRMRMQAA